MKNWWKACRAWWAEKRTPQGDDDFIDIDPEKEPSDQEPGRFNGLARLRPGAKRDQQLASLQAGYEEVVGLIRSIRGHLESQQQAQEELRESMTRFNRTLETMDETSRETVEAMQRMMDRSERRLLAVLAALVLVLAAAIAAALYIGTPASGTRDVRIDSRTTPITPGAESVPDTPTLPENKAIMDEPLPAPEIAPSGEEEAEEIFSGDIGEE